MALWEKVTDYPIECAYLLLQAPDHILDQACWNFPGPKSCFRAGGQTLEIHFHLPEVPNSPRSPRRRLSPRLALTRGTLDRSIAEAIGTRI